VVAVLLVDVLLPALVVLLVDVLLLALVLSKEEMRLAAQVAPTLLLVAALVLVLVPGLNKVELLRSTTFLAAVLVLAPGLNKVARK
jgi:hypothetical protein